MAALPAAPTSSGSHASKEHRAVKAKGPHHWNPEVVRALSSRLPYGRGAVTTRCDACRSVFYPCLCTKGQNGTDVVCVPRIVEVYEHRRLQPGDTGMGNLHLVRASNFTHALDRRRLLLWTQDSSKMSDYVSCSIVARRGDTYVVHLDEETAWVQDFTVTQDELDKLVASFTAAHLHHPDDGLMVVDDAVFGRTVRVRYEEQSEAVQDFSLVCIPCPLSSPLPQPSHDSGADQRFTQELTSVPRSMFYVTRVSGQAEANGMRPGQLLKKVFYHKRLDLVRSRKEFFEPDAAILAPFCNAPSFEATSRLGQSLGRALRTEGVRPNMCPSRGLTWPCNFEFVALPGGWTAACSVDAQGEPGEALASVEELSSLPAGTTIRFTRPPIAAISRNELHVRHQHSWELAVLNRGVRHSTDPDSDDLHHLWEWGVKSHLTAPQLEYTFNKLITSLTSGLQAFELERERREQELLQKAWRCAVLQSEGSSAESLRLARNELRFLCGQCPLHFLYALRDGCRCEDVVATSTLRRARTMGPEDLVELTGEGGTCDQQQAARIREHLVARMPVRLPGQALAATAVVRTQPSGAHGELAKAFQQQVLGILADVVECYLKEIDTGDAAVQPAMTSHVRGLRGRVAVKWNAGKTHYYKDYAGRADGRLSLEEFVKVLYSAGISWLTKEEMHHKFDAMDVDSSGYLSLGEVLRFSERTVELVRQLREHEQQLERERPRQGSRKLTARELLEDFVRARCPDFFSDKVSP